MKHTITYLVISLCFPFVQILLTGCSQESLNTDQTSKEQIIRALDFYGIIHDSSSWQLLNAIDQENILQFEDYQDYSGGYFYYGKLEGDTSYWLAFEYYYSASDSIFVPTELYKRYEYDMFQHILLLGENSDTLFYYKASLYQNLHKIFISGKYYYQYMFNELTKSQREYFRQHQDSLTQIRGNNLIPLPNRVLSHL